jgi:cytidylate kinase
MRKGIRHDLAALIDRQVERYSRCAPLDEEPAGKERRKAHAHVAVSRDAGVDAGPVARAIGDITGFELLDRELVEGIARSARVPATVATIYDLNPHDELEQMIADLPFMKLFSEDDYVHHLRTVVSELAGHGRVVFVGHAAGLVLPAARGVRVHLTAPLEERARWRAIADAVSIDEGRKRIDDEDRRRRRFCESHFGHAPQHMEVADLIIDVTNTGPREIARIVLQCLERKGLASSRRTASEQATEDAASRATRRAWLTT